MTDTEIVNLFKALKKIRGKYKYNKGRYQSYIDGALVITQELSDMPKSPTSTGGKIESNVIRGQEYLDKATQYAREFNFLNSAMANVFTKYIKHDDYRLLELLYIYTDKDIHRYYNLSRTTLWRRSQKIIKKISKSITDTETEHLVRYFTQWL